jgi:peptidoglycan hydrolase CwlO-like protein
VRTLKNKYWKVFNVLLVISLIVALGIVVAIFAKEISEKGTIQKENNELKSKAALLQTQIVELNTKISTLENENKELLNQREKLEVERNELITQIENLKNQIIELKNKISTLEAKNKELLNEKEKLQLEKNELLEKRKALENEIIQLGNKIAEMNSTIADLQEKIKELEEEIEKEEKKKEWTMLEPPYYLIEGENLVPGFHPQFFEEFERRAGRANLLGGYRLVEGVKKYYSDIITSTVILAILPISSGIEEYRELAETYPEVVPLSVDKVKEFIQKYGVPLLYFAKDPETGKIRGLIVAHSIDPSLADLFFDKGVVLNVPFYYFGGEIKIFNQ